MEVRIVKDYDELSREAAQQVASVIRSRSQPVLGLATGSTPEGMYRELVRMNREDGLDFSQVKTFNLDEYLGLEPSHPHSFRYYMDTRLFGKVNLPLDSIHCLQGDAEDPAKECSRFEAAIPSAGGVDLQVLGIGRNGHIGFNEPGSDPDGRTGVVTLSEGTRRANARYFPSEKAVPRQALSMGIGTILDSRQILMLAFGREKAGAVYHMVRGKVTSQWPATHLQVHPKVTVLADYGAASLP
jgi:glucosamine-6-phosphate deaminase